MKATIDSAQKKSEKKKVTLAVKPLDKEMAHVTSQKVLKQHEALNTPRKAVLKTPKHSSQFQTSGIVKDRKPADRGTGNHLKLIKKVEVLE